jgi:hypothetical protein
MKLKKIELSYLRYEQIDKIKWDKTMQESTNGLVYGLSWYLDAVTHDRWDALVSNDYQYIMPLPIKKKAHVCYLPMPRFIQQLGIFSRLTVDSDICNQFIEKIPKKVKLVEYQFNTANPIENISEGRFFFRRNLILHLPDDKTKIASNFSENILRNIKKAEKVNIRFNHCSIRNLISLFNTDKGKQIPTWNADAENTLERLYNMCAMRGLANLQGAYNSEGELIAGALLIQWKNRAIFLFSGNTAYGKENGAMPALIHNYLLNCPSEISIFDFEGSDNEGLARFYASFGANESNYVHLKQNNLPFYLSWMKK